MDNNIFFVPHTNWESQASGTNLKTKEIPCLTGKGKPTAETAGAVGCWYMDTDSGTVYKCIAAADGVFTWIDLVNNDELRCIVAAYLQENPPEDGADGGHYTPVITQPTADTIKVEFLPSRAGMAAVEPVAIKLPVGSGNDSSQNADFNSLKDSVDTMSGLVEDICVGFDGTTYATAGEAVREQSKSAGGFAKLLPTGKNILNRNTNILGMRLLENGMTEPAASYETTDFIAITGNTEYCFSDNGGTGTGGLNEEMHRILFYDENQEKISYVNKIAVYPFTSPENAKYIRFSFVKTKSLPQFEQGSKITGYESFVGSNLIDGNRIGFVPKSITPREVSFFGTKAGGKNLLDRTKSIIGYNFDSNGTLISSPKCEISDYIPVTYGDNIIVSGTPDEGSSRVYAGLAMYDEFKKLVYIETYSAYIPNPLSVPQNVKYIRYAYRKAGIDVQIERGTEITDYEEFIPVPCLNNDYLNLKLPKDFNYTVNPWFGKKLVVDGDSITHDQGYYDYWQFVAAQLTDMYVDNTDTQTPYANGWKGVGGSRIANELGAKDRKSVV